MNGPVIRVNISLPSELVKDLKKRTRRREFSRFMAEAAEEKIAKEKREKALKELLEAPAAFMDIEDSTKWVRETRKLDENRLKRLGI